MRNKELLNKYISKKQEFLGILSDYGLAYAINKNDERLKELDKQGNEKEQEMLAISRTFIESFL